MTGRLGPVQALQRRSGLRSGRSRASKSAGTHWFASDRARHQRRLRGVVRAEPRTASPKWRARRRPRRAGPATGSGGTRSSPRARASTPWSPRRRCAAVARLEREVRLSDRAVVAPDRHARREREQHHDHCARNHDASRDTGREPHAACSCVRRRSARASRRARRRAARRARRCPRVGSGRRRAGRRPRGSGSSPRRPGRRPSAVAGWP